MMALPTGDLKVLQCVETTTYRRLLVIPGETRSEQLLTLKTEHTVFGVRNELVPYQPDS